MPAGFILNGQHRSNHSILASRKFIDHERLHFLKHSKCECVKNIRMYVAFQYLCLDCFTSRALLNFVTGWFNKIRNIPLCVSGGKKCSFSENLACLVFMKHPFWDSPFCFITDELRYYKNKKQNKNTLYISPSN